jgi:hypothetical protein
MTARAPSFFMLVPGPFRGSGDVLAALGRHGIEAGPRGDGAVRAGEIRVEVIEDAELADGFSWGRRGRLSAEIVRRVGEQGRAALIEYGARLDENPKGVAALGRALRDAGGVAVRMEASGAASDWETWIAQLESGEPSSVYASAVVLVGGGDGPFFTCGMHQFDLPDAEVTMSGAQEASAWLDSFCVYQLAEQPGLASGHTFQPHAEAKRRAFDRWPDHRHHPDDGRHNPFGLWRFRQPGEVGPTNGKLVPTIIPPLVAVLLAHERSTGKPLTQPEVEGIVSKSPAIMMEARHVLAVERARGYADIEPQLAWEQWQIVRKFLSP